MSASRKAIWRRVLVILLVALVLQLYPTPAASASSCPFFYQVRSGDTLSSIARRFGTTVSAIAQANGICNLNLIIVGQCLLIPCPTACPCPTTCDPCPVTCVPCQTTCIHIVQCGDTLTRIAIRFGTTVCTLQELNGICNPNLIFIGQRLRVC